MAFSSSLSKLPSLSREDEDLLERSVKKSKLGKRSLNETVFEGIPETPMEEMGMDQDQQQEADNGDHTGDNLNHTRISYRESLTRRAGGMQTESKNQMERRIRTLMMIHTMRMMTKISALLFV